MGSGLRARTFRNFSGEIEGERWPRTPAQLRSVGVFAAFLTLVVMSCYGGDQLGPEIPEFEDEAATGISSEHRVMLISDAGDRDLLTELYNSTGGTSWTDADNWLDTTVALNNWFGVTANQLNQVNRLWLHNNNLAGSLPDSVGQFLTLDTLNLGMNELTGGIPTGLGDLSTLRIAYLQRNQFSGAIPIQLGNLNELQLLNLRYNQLTGAIPGELGSLTNLEILNLGDNQLTGELPSELALLTSLHRFIVSGNTSLCRPDDSAFTAWLNGIEDTDALELATCPDDPTDPPEPPLSEDRGTA